MNNADAGWLAHAVLLAKRYIGQTAPNPAVGCVIVKNGRRIGAGAHQKAGTPHAEVHALRQTGHDAKGATAYVTLEPCNHHGRTPPCTEALIAAGIKRVVYGAVDPNPKVRGKGIARLRRAGIQVQAGPLPNECADLIADFKTWTLQKRPYVIYKVASTWEGVTAIAGQGSVQITGQASQKRVHELRATCDAVVVGANTWRLDDPDLRPRLATGGKRPLRVVVATTLPAPRGKLARIEPTSVLWICRTASRKHKAAWQRLGARVVALGRPTTPARILAVLWAFGVHRVLLEGGATLAGSFLAEKKIDTLVMVFGPQKLVNQNPLGLFANMRGRRGQKKAALTIRSTEWVGRDCWVRATVT